ncbi:MAG: ATP-binding protein [Thermoplasmata archaeon]|nr:ATP-binding protein [Thermoplasmata archaeon]
MSLKPWREVIIPHKDVSSGKYQQAEFAADLAQVLSGKAEPEYQDASEFFSRTYLTEGMKLLLASALRRACNINGEPVIQLKTAFGGGKTHTMLAIYHLFNDKTIANHDVVKSVLKFTGIKEIPEVKIAVLVGTAIDPAKPRTIPGFKHKINTLWGYMAYQLGKEDAYELVKEADQRSVAPGGDTLVELFDTYGPCIILIDELVAYTRNIYNKEGLPSGSFESIMTFTQNITEATRRSKNSMVIAAIPESNIEIGGEGGKAALERIENTFGRLEAIWAPVKAHESFEIVRRRLFEPVDDEKAKEKVCQAFSALYTKNSNDFPSECKELSYLERLREAYPIHPEVFDRLYTDWSTLERFQRTRGVLRLMAATIHQLWIQGDKSLMIMPGHIPLDAPKVRDELTHYLSDEWNGIVDNDVDGERSETKKLDETNKRFGINSAARRVSRTIFFGSAPSSKEQKNRGIEDLRIMLGVVQPEEPIATFRDALATLTQKLTYLYFQNNRYWYDSHPNLRKTVEDRATKLDEEEVFAEINKRLHTIREKGDFAGIHISAESEDIPDEGEVRLVIISPKQPYRKDTKLSEANFKAKEILDKRGNIPRQDRNMLIFLAADAEIITVLNSDVRRYLAWQSVIADQDALNLDAHQRRQADASVSTMNQTVSIRLNEAYIWLLVPTQEGTKPITIESKRVTKGEGSFITRASKQVRNEELLIVRWSPALLKNELDKWLWKDKTHLGLKQLWEYFASYPYLPRLKDASVLTECIKEGVRSRDFFAYASSIEDTGKYLGLEFGNPGAFITIDPVSVLVKKEIALKQIIEEEKQLKPTSSAPLKIGEKPAKTPEQILESKKLLKRFCGRVDLDSTRVSRDIDQIASEVIQHLSSLPSAEVNISLEITANVPSGIPEKTVRILLENCKTLKFKLNDFEE